jgi:hypothetical protein
MMISPRFFIGRSGPRDSGCWLQGHGYLGLLGPSLSRRLVLLDRQVIFGVTSSSASSISDPMVRILLAPQKGLVRDVCGPTTHWATVVFRYLRIYFPAARGSCCGRIQDREGKEMSVNMQSLINKLHRANAIASSPRVDYFNRFGES